MLEYRWPEERKENDIREGVVKRGGWKDGAEE